MEQNKVPPQKKQASQDNSENPVKEVVSTISPDNTTPTSSTEQKTKGKKHPKCKMWWKHNDIQWQSSYILYEKHNDAN